MQRLFLLLSYLGLSFMAYGQSYIPNTVTYTTKDGLSSNEVRSIHKDARGFMWIGTQYGLNRFDGQEFKIFTRENTPELDFDIINNILEDDKGNLWLVKSQEKYQHAFNTMAINLFNIYSGKIQSLEEYFGSELPFEVKDITYIQQLSDSSIFIHCNKIQKTFRYRSKQGFQAISFPTEFVQIADVLLTDEHLLVSTAAKNNFAIYEMNWSGEILNKGFWGLQWKLKDGERTYPLETWGYYNLKAFEHFSPDWEALNWKLHASETSIYQTEFNPTLNLFWLREHRRISAVTPNGQLVFALPLPGEDVKRSPFFFDGTTTWFSSKKEGLIAITLEPNHFQALQFFDNPLDNSMRGIIKDKSGTLWFSSIHGLGKIDPQKQVSIIETDDGFSNFLKDSQGNIWGHHNRGLVKHDLKNNRESKFKIPFYNYAWSFYETDHGEIWIGGGFYNFIALNPKTGKHTQKGKFPIDDRSVFDIYHFQKRDKETVWVCSNQGLFIVNLDGEILATYHDQQTGEYYFPAKDFRHIYQNENELWIATGNAGLFQVKNNTTTIDELKIKKQYTSTTGLSSNSLHAVYADDFDYLWISSDHGLMQLDRRDGQVFKYFKSNGIQHNEFNRIAHYQDVSGLLYFGGLYGITSFDPKHFSKQRNKVKPPKLEIAGFKQFSGSEDLFKNKTASLLETNQIILQPNDRFFKIKLGLLDFKNIATGQTNGKSSIFQYRIKGFYDWQNTQNNELIISGLPYGNHTLEIKAQNGSLQYATNELVINVQVLRPFYLTWWFMLIALFGIAVGTFFILKKRTQQMMARQEASQLKELDKMKSRFFANISHELRTPLTLIGLPLEHLMKNFDEFSKEEIMQYLASAHSNKEDLNRLVNEILDLSKLESGKLELEKKTVPLQHFLKRVVGIFETSAKAKGIQFRYLSIIDEKVTVQLDASKLEMVINNLLSNALKFTSKNGSISIRTEWTKNQELYFEVKDNGRGIHAEDLPFIFERYFQTNKKHLKLEGGSGIGLAFCKELLELMGGEIQVLSKIEEGSTFEIQIPLELGNANTSIDAFEKSNISTIPSMSTPTISPLKKSTILIVEDHLELQQHLQNILSSNYNMLTAANGIEALEILEKNLTPHLIISDVMMPEMDGFTLLEKVKAKNEYCGIPFILLTARTEVQDKLQGLRIGVDAYMTKPFEIEELLLRVKNLLANAKNRVINETELIAPKHKSKTSKSDTNFKPLPLSNLDLEWLHQVENIALREIKNTHYSVDNLAKELLLSRSKTYRKIKRITGLTPKKYLNAIRLQKAKTILETQKIETLKEVCLAIGFENSTHFSKLYENEFGKRPHAYLNKSEV